MDRARVNTIYNNGSPSRGTAAATKIVLAAIGFWMAAGPIVYAEETRQATIDHPFHASAAPTSSDQQRLTRASSEREPIPDKLVVLTFDDSSKSHFTIVRPLLKQYGFGATFFITEGFDFRENKKDYMSWEEIVALHRDGFEIGNHTRDHLSITDDRVLALAEQLEGIAKQCELYGIPRPTSFAWPGNAFSVDALPVLRSHGIHFARRGGGPEFPYEEGKGFAFEPGSDHPLLLPSAGDARPAWTMEDFTRGVEQARDGKVAILQFHGVPDTAHAWVNTLQGQFEDYLRYLAHGKYHVIALRDLAR